MSDMEIATRALRCLDLTDLTDQCSNSAVAELCRKAQDPRGPVAAVCVWPQFVRQAVGALQGSSVRVATVINFPQGRDDLARIGDDAEAALADGASEIDLVLPYTAFRHGDRKIASDTVETVRDIVDRGRVLKVILETGELAEPALIDAASRLAIAAGADFIKTSTGKTAVSATREAAEIMLRAIKASGRAVGLKPSGGIRTLTDARVYLDLADQIMGPDWATPRTFRIGASSVFDALIATLEGRAARAARGVY